jgi:hypothetical protein
MGDFNYPKLEWTNWNSNGDKEGGAFMESIRDSFSCRRIYKNKREQ